MFALLVRQFGGPFEVHSEHQSDSSMFAELDEELRRRKGARPHASEGLYLKVAEGLHPPTITKVATHFVDGSLELRCEIRDRSS